MQRSCRFSNFFNSLAYDSWPNALKKARLAVNLACELSLLKGVKVEYSYRRLQLSL